MNRLIAVVLLAGSCFSSALAQDQSDESDKAIRIGLNVGYTWVAMNEMNKQLDEGSDVRALGSGVSGILDLDFLLGRFVMVGIRSGYLYSIPGHATYDFVLYEQTTTVQASLLPVEVGFSLNLGSPSAPFSITTAIYGGYGFAFASFDHEFNALGRKEIYSEPYLGGSLIAELLARVNFKLSSAVSINVNGGYRLANVQRLEQSRDVDFDPIPGVTIPVGSKGDELQNFDGDQLGFDYSGMNIGLGMSLSF